MIEIKIIDAANEKADVLRTIAQCINQLADFKEAVEAKEIPKPEAVLTPAGLLPTPQKPSESAAIYHTAEPISDSRTYLPPEMRPFEPALVPPANNPFAKPPAPVADHIVQTVKAPSIPVPPPIAPALPPIPQVAPTDPTKVPSTVPATDADAAGLPWDARIHSRTKSKNIDGTWKLMRGVNPATVKAVKDELQQRTASPAIYTGHVPGTPVVVPGIPPAPVSVATVADFPSLMTKATQSIEAGLITPDRILQIVKEMGLNSLAAVATRPELISIVMDRIEAATLVGSN